MSDMSEKTPRYDVSRIGDNIASMRRNAGLTQEGLAFQLGISAQAVSKWERGVACPDAGMVLLLHPEKGRTELCGQERKAADYVKCDRE